jgi:hypothetical protein
MPLTRVDAEHASYYWKNVLISFWTGASTPSGLAVHEQGLKPLYARYPQGLSSISFVVRGSYAMPNPEVRNELARLVREYAPLTAAAAIVVDGQGFLASAVRGVVTALTLVSPGATKLNVFNSAREVADWLPPIHLARTGIKVQPDELFALLESAQRAHAQLR